MRRTAVFSAVLLLALGCTLVSREPGTDPRLRKASRTSERNGWIQVHLEGTPGEIGFQHGALLAALGYFLNAGAALASSTSQSATIFSVGAAPSRIWGPRVPSPITAIFSFSFKDLYPGAGREGVRPTPPEGTAPASRDP